MKENRTYDTWQDGFLSIFNIIKRDKDFIINIYHHISKDYLYRYLYKATYQLLYAVLEENADSALVKEEDKSFIANFYKYGFVGVPEVWGSKYDVRELLRATYYAIDKKTLDKFPMSFKEKFLYKIVLKAIKGTDIEILLRESGLIK